MIFSELLSVYIERSGKTEAQLAKSCGLARSYIALMRTGQRIPTRKKLETLIAALELSPQESRRLWVQWENSKAGPGIGKRRWELFRLIMDFSVFTEQPLHINRPIHIAQNAGADPMPDLPVVYGRENIQALIRELIIQESGKEKGEIMCMLQDPEILAEGVRCCPALKLQMILCIESCQISRTSQAENLAMLRKCLNLFLLGVDDAPVYYYGSPDTLDSSGMPYIIRTSDTVMQFSNDLMCAVIHKEAPILRLWAGLLEKRLQSGLALWEEIPYTEDISKGMSHAEIYMIGAAAFVDAMNLLEGSINGYCKGKKVTTYFSQKHFSQTAGMEKLKNFFDAVNDGVCEAYCMDEKYLVLPEGLSVICDGSSVVFRYFAQKKMLRIKENSLVEMIQGILSGLKESIYVSDFRK